MALSERRVNAHTQQLDVRTEYEHTVRPHDPRRQNCARIQVAQVEDEAIQAGQCSDLSLVCQLQRLQPPSAHRLPKNLFSNYEGGDHHGQCGNRSLLNAPERLEYD